MKEKTCANCKHQVNMLYNMHYTTRTAYCKVAGKSVRKKYFNNKVRPCCEFENEPLKNKEEQK